MRTEHLTGFKLDYWTARADLRCSSEVDFRRNWSNFYSPSTSWQTCGRLQDQYDVEVSQRKLGSLESKARFFARVPSSVMGMPGPDRKTAICRAIIASVFGEEVHDDSLPSMAKTIEV